MFARARGPWRGRAVPHHWRRPECFPEPGLSRVIHLQTACGGRALDADRKNGTHAACVPQWCVLIACSLQPPLAQLGRLPSSCISAAARTRPGILRASSHCETVRKNPYCAAKTTHFVAMCPSWMCCSAFDAASAHVTPGRWHALFLLYKPYATALFSKR